MGQISVSSKLYTDSIATFSYDQNKIKEKIKADQRQYV